MKKNYTLIFILIFTSIGIINAQTCSTYTYNPTIPASCDYTYVNGGWEDALGNPTTAPSKVDAGVTVCILEDNSDDMPNSGVKGTLYVGPGATYTGELKSLNGGTLIVEGHADLSSLNPSIVGATIYIGSNGEITIPGDLSPSGSTTIYNNGTFSIAGDIQITGSASFISFPSSHTTALGDGNISSNYTNCGILEVYGDMSSGGSSSLTTYCATYVHGDMHLNGDYTNDALLLIDGDLTFGTVNLYNNDIIIVNNLELKNDNLIGNDDNSMLVVRQNASLTSGGTITGHLYFDIDDGGGFDSVCAGCVEDIDEVVSLTIPESTTIILESCGANIIPDTVYIKSRLDFDGVNDFIHAEEFIDGQNQITIMGWVKSDSGNSTDMTIAGEDIGCKLWLDNGNIPSFTIKSVGNSTATLAAPAINLNEWHHIAGTYNSTDGALKLYIDGTLTSTSNVSGLGAAIQCSANKNGNFEIGRTSEVKANREYFKGDIDEVRVFDIALTDSQIQRSIYQEIEDESGIVKGKVIDKPLEDIDTGATISWNNVLAYYPMMDIISYDRTSDFSNTQRRTRLNNMSTIQEQTAPLPYVTTVDGDWTNEATWLHGDVWDIEDITTESNYRIVKISNNVTMSHDINHIGLIVDSGKTLSTTGDIGITNSWYLELNGTLDLADDSQLIQTSTSDLVTSASGKILRRQEGQSSPFRYNYWSSPIGITSATTLTDNNAAINNTNNTNFTTGMLKDKDGVAMSFTGGFTGSNSISTRWMYTFINGVTYWDWNQVNSISEITPGVGYTQKGTGTSDPNMQYIFEGKPNNGTILLNVVDTGGPGSVESVSRTDYLVGNPYPSAIDVHQFINDNAGVIDGDINIWEHWGGNSHVLNEYEGGYATINILGSIRAYQFTGYEGDTTGEQNGTLTPTRYIPVGQGFMVEIIADGTLEFNNSQRIFVKEADADGTYNTGSVFAKPSQKTKTYSNKGNNSNDLFTTLKLLFLAKGNSKASRELLLGFSSQTSDGFDYGYDCEHKETSNTDLNLELEGKPYVIQAYSELTKDKVVQLLFKTSESNSFEIKLSNFENLDENQPIFLKDTYSNTLFNLRTEGAYSFTSEAGVFNDRFEIVFKDNETLNVEENLASNVLIQYENNQHKLFVKNFNSFADEIRLTNMLGQITLKLKNISQKELSNGLPIPNLAKGVYVVSLTSNNNTLVKKIIIK